ncbi:MAG: ABC transporter substrate-binding protein [Candidatus Hydrogenedentes bacterium]|nr:ABC transporter substrate-binding protein [Candidatus Hydrogenedentota bacterium]
MTGTGTDKNRQAGLVAVLAVLVAAWAGAAETFHEAPMLAEKVAAGELPPVEERLPADPLVVEPVERIGTYGGTWRRLALGGADVQLTARMGYDPLVRWDRTGQGVAPGLAASWDILDEGRTYVFRLRTGLKWSDGHPLTAADFMFYYEDVLCNEELSPVFPAWLTVGGQPVKMSAPDARTLEFRFAEPLGVFPGLLAYQGNGILMPKHYLSRFHPRYADEADLEREMKEHELSLWQQLFWRKANQNENPELPTWKPFRIVVPPPANRMIAERNPFYWKVDPAGNQLPYIDRIAFTDVQNNEVITMKAMAGEVDFQARRVDASNYALFVENSEPGGYRVMRDLAPDTVALYVNQCSKDAELRALLQDRRFRIALSLAIDREELIFLLYSGMAVPSRGVISPMDPHYRPEFDAKYLNYDPERANALLDEIGMVRGRGGLRRMPPREGKPADRPFRQILNVYPSEAGTSSDLWQLVADYFREVGLDFVIKIDAGSLSVLQIRNGNSDFWAYQQPGLQWEVDPKWHLPLTSTSYFAPLYGRYQGSNGKDRLGVKPSAEWQQMLDWYSEMSRIVGDTERKRELGHRILRQWAEECYVVGICRQELLTIVSNRFHNVPEHIIHDWRLYTPGYIGIEQFYMDGGE